jgi:hypothetical protein
MGQGVRLFLDFDALGCLCSLRARLALDGVSWAQGGEVENAVGFLLAACDRIGAQSRRISTGLNIALQSARIGRRQPDSGH